MNGVSTFRLYLLRVPYLLMAVGLGLMIWPQILDPSRHWELMHGVVVSMLGALCVLALLGLRYPLQMLPLLLFEMTWKVIWLLRVALVAQLSHRMDADTAETASQCLWILIFPFFIPWRYLLDHYVRKAGDPWRPSAQRTPV